MSRQLVAIALMIAATSMCVVSEKYQFFLDILDMLDTSWVHSKYDVIGTKIKCASLCYHDRDNCEYFGYKNHECYLLKDTVDRDSCSQDDCSDSGMKIYKWKKEITTTTVPASTTTTTTTTTEPPEPTTTTTTTSTTPKPTTTTTTGKPTTTTTEEPTTTTTKEPTTTTTTREPSTTTTTMEPTTTTTTEPPTTSTTELSTTTTTTEAPSEDFVCDPTNGGAEGEVFCPQPKLIKGIGTRFPFFSDGIGGLCSAFNEYIYSDDEHVQTFVSPDGGFSLSAYCPDDDQVITKFKLCVIDAHIHALTLHCQRIKDPDIILDRFNESSDEFNHVKVVCDDQGNDVAVNKMYFMDSGDGVITKIVFTCIRVEVEELVPQAPEPAAGGM